MVAVLVIVASVGIIGLVVTGGLGSGGTSAAGNANQGQNATENVTDGGSVASQNGATPANATENANAADDASNDQTAAQNQEAPAQDSSQQGATAIERYRAIVAGASGLGPFWGDALTPTGTYQYAIVTMQKGEGPTLLLSQGESNGTSLVRVYYYDEATGTLYGTGANGNAFDDNNNSTAYMQYGVSAAGGFRGELSMEPDGNGVMLTEWSSGSGEGDTVRFTRSGNSLVSSVEGSFSMRNGDEAPAGKKIQWFDASDTNGLDSWSGQESGSATASGQGGSDGASSSESAPATGEHEAAQDSHALEGTYKSAEGNSLSFETEDGSLVEKSSGSTLHLRQDANGIYHGIEATAGFQFDTDASPIQVHLLTGDGDTVYTKVIG